MGSRTAITVHRPVDEIRRMWDNEAYRPRYISELGAAVTYRDAPGDRGTEIHVDLHRVGSGRKLGQKLVASLALAKVEDDLRHFKQLVETGEITRSEGTPEGERVERKMKQRPAQPLAASELEKAGV